jgi:CheY-like chemotaxis protein
MQKYNILWADDEIELLKPHIIFLEDKGYQICSVNNGQEAVDQCDQEYFDVVFLDENMPGMTGLEALAIIKENHPDLPVVMITKSEEEYIMDEALGSKITDYLIKPLNPKQILLSIKKILDHKKLITEKTNLSYQQDFQKISIAYNENLDTSGWAEIYKKLVFWESEIEGTIDKSMGEVVSMQKTDANTRFSEFVRRYYQDWVNPGSSPNPSPLMSHQLLEKKVFPMLGHEEPVFLIVIDNLRYDQWLAIKPEISNNFNLNEEGLYYSILPTTTAYSRNSLFSGLLPLDMARFHPELWVGEQEEEGKNMHEEEFLTENLKRSNLNCKSSYHKILNQNHGRALNDSLNNLYQNDLNVIVFNFVDMLSHARTDMDMIRQLAPHEAAYISLTKSWFEHSPLIELLNSLARKKVRVFITTDHGTIRVKRPYKIVGDRNVNSNLRYKVGKSLGFKEKEVMVTRNPEELKLPKQNVSTAYVFASDDYFFAYPNNFNHHVKLYSDTFQHGGISMEEMIIPYVSLTPKS